MDKPDDISRMKVKERRDGITVLVDPGTVKTKKNRHRHIKDGAPKSERGKQHNERLVVAV